MNQTETTPAADSIAPSSVASSSPSEAPQPIPSELPLDAPAIDRIIRQFDDCLNGMRAKLPALKSSAETKVLTDCMGALIAMQAFMREVRRLLEDIL